MTPVGDDEPDVRQCEVDGVPVYWVDGSGRLSARLVFGVGIADETFLTTGITHLVEHLTMGRLGEYAHAANAGVGISVTTFDVSSSPPVVAGHLRRLCLALAEPDLARLDVERAVLGAEEHTQEPATTTWWPLALRYGGRGPGLAGNRQLAPHLAGADEVREWCRRWFHRGNVALVLDGPPPPGLTLPLPDGPPPRRVPAPVLALSTPAWVPGVPGGVLVSLFGAWSAELATGLSVLCARLTRALRHEAGLVYDVGTDVVQLPGGTAAVGIGAEVPDGQVWTVVQRLLDTVDELCAHGPDEAELAHDRDGLRELLGDPEVVLDGPMDVAVERLTGIAGAADERARVLAGLNPADVAAALRSARESMVVGLPPGHAMQRLPELPAGLHAPAGGRELGRARWGSSVPRGSRLVLGADTVGMAVGRAAEALAVRYADVVGVGVEPGPSGRAGDEVLSVFAGSGDVLVLRGPDWRDGQLAVDALRTAVPAELFFPQPPGMRLSDG